MGAPTVLKRCRRRLGTGCSHEPPARVGGSEGRLWVSPLPKQTQTPGSGPPLSGQAALAHPSPLHPGMLFWKLVTQLDPAFISGIELLPQ